MWEAVEKTRGVYDDQYLSKVNDLINKLGDAGIYTLVDAHQDVMARVMCGEGMPDFYAKEILQKESYCVSPMVDYILGPIFHKFGFCESIKSYSYKYDKNGDPLIKDCQTKNFSQYYESPDSLTIFRAMYMNNFGLQDNYVAYWNKVAESLSANKFVVGFDPFNEPFPSWKGLKDTLNTLYPGHFDKNNLAPLYAKINEKFQAVSKENVMWFEPGQFPDSIPVFGHLIGEVGFETPPGGQIGSPNHIFNDHTYCCQLGFAVCATGEPGADMAPKCQKFHDEKMGNRV
jgi:endoglycosylceramidase